MSASYDNVSQVSDDASTANESDRRMAEDGDDDGDAWMPALADPYSQGVVVIDDSDPFGVEEHKTYCANKHAWRLRAQQRAQASAVRSAAAATAVTMITVDDTADASTRGIDEQLAPFSRQREQEASPQQESASRSVVVASPSKPRPTAIRSPANRASASDLADALALDAAPGAGVAIRPLLPVAIPVPCGGPGTADESAGVGSGEEIVVWFHERATLITGEAAQKWHRDLRDAIRRGPQRWTDFGMSVSLSRVACVPLHQQAAFFLRRLYTQSMVDSNIVGTSLAPANMNPGRIIYHATKMINNILDKYEIGKFKVGVTVKPLHRFYDGYAAEGYTRMYLLWASVSGQEAACAIEGSLIHHYKTMVRDIRCQNAADTGEGCNCGPHHHELCVTWVYVAVQQLLGLQMQHLNL